MEIYQADQIAAEIYAVLVKHNLTVSDAERVLEHTETSFKYARLSSNESPIFEEGDTRLKTDQTFAVLTPTINVKSDSNMDEIVRSITNKLNDSLRASSLTTYN